MVYDCIWFKVHVKTISAVSSNQLWWDIMQSGAGEIPYD